jgi:hypothetical protein
VLCAAPHTVAGMAGASPLRVLAGWPRRAAAALCFLMAIATALSGHRPAPARAAAGNPIPAGLVATTAVVSADAAAFVHIGERIDLVAPTPEQSGEQSGDPPAPVVASGVQVLAIRQSVDGVGGTRVVQLLVAARREVAVQIAARQGSEVLAAISAPP